MWLAYVSRRYTAPRRDSSVSTLLATTSDDKRTSRIAHLRHCLVFFRPPCRYFDLTGQVSTPKAEETEGVGLGFCVTVDSAKRRRFCLCHLSFLLLGPAAVQPDYDYVTRPTGRGIENKRSALQEDLRRGCCEKYSLLLHRLVGMSISVFISTERVVVSLT
jgi:hypothetical protein